MSTPTPSQLVEQIQTLSWNDRMAVVYQALRTISDGLEKYAETAESKDPNDLISNYECNIEFDELISEIAGIEFIDSPHTNGKA